MDFKNLKRMTETIAKNKELELESQQKSIVGNIEIPFIDPVKHLNMLDELLNDVGG